MLTNRTKSLVDRNSNELERKGYGTDHAVEPLTWRTVSKTFSWMIATPAKPPNANRIERKLATRRLTLTMLPYTVK